MVETSRNRQPCVQGVFFKVFFSPSLLFQNVERYGDLFRFSFVTKFFSSRFNILRLKRIKRTQQVNVVYSENWISWKALGRSAYTRWYTTWFFGIDSCYRVILFFILFFNGLFSFVDLEFVAFSSLNAFYLLKCVVSPAWLIES